MTKSYSKTTIPTLITLKMVLSNLCMTSLRRAPSHHICPSQCLRAALEWWWGENSAALRQLHPTQQVRACKLPDSTTPFTAVLPPSTLHCTPGSTTHDAPTTSPSTAPGDQNIIETNLRTPSDSHIRAQETQKLLPINTINSAATKARFTARRWATAVLGPSWRA